MKKTEKIYNLKIIESGTRLEVYKFNNYALREGFETSKEIQEGQTEFNLDSSPTKEQIKANRCKTLHKSQNSIIRLIQANNTMTTFITLTFKEIHDYKNSKKELNNFFNKLRRFSPNLKYLWVLEYGYKNNRLHFHILTDLFNNLDLKVNGKKSMQHKSLESKFMNKFWKLGFVDIRDFKAEDNINVALYVSQYIIKSLSDVNLEGYRIYGYSHKTLEKPKILKIYSKDSIEDILNSFKDYKLKYQSSYEVGFSDWKGKRKGIVSYFDFEKENNYEIK